MTMTAPAGSAQIGMARMATVRGERIIAIDVLRGIAVAGMLLVNDPGDPAHVFAPLRHSVWHGWTPADLVFPFFLFVVGITTQMSLERRKSAGVDRNTVRRAVYRRAAIIFSLGIFLNAYPFFEKAALAGPSWLPPAFGHVAARLENLRIMGVLQRIAVVYLAASLLSWRTSTRRLGAIGSVLLVGYWIIMTWIPVPGEGASGAALLNTPARTMAAWFDRTMLDWTRLGLGWHLWDPAVPYDPEGLLSTLPSVATVLVGVLAGRLLAFPRPITDRVTALSASGALVMMSGAVWSWWFPINKPIWTSSYVLFTGGMACLALGAIMWLVDVKQWTRGLTPLLVFGTNPILAYFGGELLATVLRSGIKWRVDGRLLSTGRTVVHGLEALGVDVYVASLCWAVLYVALWYVMLRPLYNRRIFLRV